MFSGVRDGGAHNSGARGQCQQMGWQRWGMGLVAQVPYKIVKGNGKFWNIIATIPQKKEEINCAGKKRKGKDKKRIQFDSMTPEKKKKKRKKKKATAFQQKNHHHWRGKNWSSGKTQFLVPLNKIKGKKKKTRQ